MASIPCTFILRLLQWGVPYPLVDSRVNSSNSSAAAAASSVEHAPEEEDEEAADADDGAPSDAQAVPSIVGGQGPLHAWVALSSSYTRELVVAALRRRSHAWTFVANNDMEAPTTVAVAQAAGTAVSPAEIAATPTPWPINLQFCEFERIDWGAGLSSPSSSAASSSSSPSPLLVSSFPVRKGLIRKAQLSFLIRKFAAKRPQSILHRTVPETHIMTVDDPEYLEEALNDVYEVRDMVEGKGQYNTRRSAGRRH